MSNVKFLRGTQAKFDQLTAFNEGAFYLTSDTNRLYYANSSTKASYLNKYIYSVVDADALAEKVTAGEIKTGDFAYITGSNSLMVMVTDTSYKQVNAYEDTNDTIETNGLTFVKSVDGGDITFNFTLSQQKKNKSGKVITSPTDITGSLVISQSDIAQIVTATAVGVTATIGDNVATVKTSGVGASADDTGFTITGTGSVKVTGNSNAIEISGTDHQYTLSSAAKSTNITLGDGSKTTSVAVNAKADSQITVDGTEANKVVIGHKVMDSTNTTPSENVVDGGSIEAISGLTLENGHVTGIATKTFNLTKSKEYKITNVGADNQGKISVTLKAGDAGSAVLSGQDLYFTVGKNTKTTVYNQGDLDVYTSTEIDKKLRELNGMTYRGAIPSDSVPTLPSSGVQSGDTYKIATAGSYDKHQCKVGDLLIASGPEGADGIIPSDSIEWTYIPSGNDTDSQFGLLADVANKKITMRNETSSANVGSITMGHGDNIEVTAVQGTSKKDIAFTVSHTGDAADKTDNTGTLKVLTSSGETNVFTAITDMTSDSHGHITAFTVDKFQLPADNNTKYDLTLADNTIDLAGTDQSHDKVEFVEGDKVTITTSTVDGNKITVAHGDVTTTADKTQATTNTAVSVAAAGTFDAITSVETDKGHVTKYKVVKYKLPEAIKNKTLSDEITASDNKATITTTLTATDSSHVSKTVNVKSTGSLSITKDETDGAIAVDLVWGSF